VTARWFETFRLTESLPELPDLSSASGERLAVVLSGAEVQAALQELLAVRCGVWSQEMLDNFGSPLG